MKKIFKITRPTLEDILSAASNTYPNEFFCLLGASGVGQKGVEKNGGEEGTKNGEIAIDEFVVVPAVYGEEHAIVRTDLVPFDSRIVGSAHSHPSRDARPSAADLDSFAAFGKIHLIIAYPFNMESVRAYDAKGRRIGIKII